MKETLRLRARLVLLMWIVALCAMVLSPPATGAVWTFDTIPASGDIAGAPGSTIGWGYTIANPEPSRFLVLTNLDADPFEHALAFSVFDLPIVPPLTTVALPFDGTNGLFGIAWDADAPIGFVNTGEFTVLAEWFDGDPFSGGLFIELAPSQVATYTATVVAAVSAPATTPLLMLALLLLGCTGAAQHTRPR